MDALLLNERIYKTIELGESQFREFKSAYQGPPESKTARNLKHISKDISETLVGFANADGGELLIGVEDDGTITGLPYDDANISKLLISYKDGVHKDTPLPNPIAKKVDINGLKCLYFAIDKSTRNIHQTSDGKCIQRKDRDTCPVSAIQLQFERHEQLSREYDRQFVEKAQVSDLDVELVNSVSQATSKMSAEKCLQYLGLAEYGMATLRIRRAALLLFSKDVTLWHPRCQVRIVRVKGIELKTGRDYNVLNDEIATGNILHLLTSSWEKLRPHLVETKLTIEGLFRERVMYPEDACREALINAITHRDYSIEGQNIEIFIFDDRMEVNSPGSLLSTVKIEQLEKLQGIHESRNALIARVLREIGYVREMGEGMRRIFNLIKDADLVPPELQSKPQRFSIILQYKSVFSEDDQIWLSSFKPLKLTREERLIALLGKDGRLISPQQIYDMLNIVDWDIYRTIIETMYSKGVLYNTMKESEKQRISRKKGVSKRQIPRLAVRQPEEVEKSLSELLSALKTIPPVKLMDKSILRLLINKIPPTNIYRTSGFRTSALLRTLGMIDDAKRPTSLLQELWSDSSLIQRPIEEKLRCGSSKRINAPSNEKTGGPIDIYVGNLPYDAMEQKLFYFFGRCGQVISVKIPIDYFTKRGRGFGFIRMSNREETRRAMDELNGQSFGGRILHLNWAR